MTDLQARITKSIDRRRPGGRPRIAGLPLVVVGVATALAGAFLAYVLDPQMGRTRRAVTRDRVAASARHVGRWSARRGRWLASTVAGLVQRARHAAEMERSEPLDEVQLAHKVESILFRDPSIDKGGINVNAERDVIFLRGTVPDARQADEIRRRVEQVDGVGKVVSLLRAPGDERAERELEPEGAQRPTLALPH